MSGRSGGGCPALMLYSSNANGLGSRDKLLQFLRWAESSPYSVLALQDHRLLVDPLGGEDGGEQSRIGWSGQHFFEPATARGQGVLLLVKDTASLSSVTLFTGGGGGRPDALEGRHQRVDFTFGLHRLCLHNIYAPARPEDRGVFYSELAGYAFGDSTGRCHVLCGDFNTTLDPADRTHATSRRVPGALELEALVATQQLVDVWRVGNPREKDFTFYSNHRSGCRLDRFYVGASLAALPGVGSEILPTAPIKTDHLPVKLTLPGSVTPDPNARSRWHFPVYLLGVPDILDQIRGWVRQTISSIPHANVPSWVSFKTRLESFIKGLDREYQAKLHLELQQEERAAATARKKMVYHITQGEYGLVAVHEIAWREARRAAEEISRKRSHTRDAVDAALQLVLGSQGINLHVKQARAPTRITHLQDYDALPNLPASAAADLSTSAGMGRGYVTMLSHFSASSPTGLFRERPGDMAAQAALLATLPRTLPPPGPGAAAPGDGLLTLADLTRALKATIQGRAPGLDGIPYEFYKALWPEVGQHLCDVLNSAFLDTSDAPLAALLEGVIALIPKAGKPRDRIQSYRGLTLLGCDVKLASLAVSDRMQAPLDFLIDEMQGAFIRGRDIADNVLFRLGLLEYLRDIGHPAWLILTDFANAYDSVRRAYLYSCLQAMGLAKKGCLRWTVLLLTGTTSSVLVNGRVLPPFPTEGGLPQGLPLSATLFVTVLHPWHTWLQSQASCGRYLRPTLPDGSAAPVLLLFADDATLIEKEEHMEQNGPVLDEGFQLLEGASKVGLGIVKCGAVSTSGREGPLPRSLRVGSMDFRVAQVDEEVRQLGVIVSTDAGEVQRRSFGQQAGAILGKAATWKGLHPRIPERVYIAHTYLISRMVYQCRFHAPNSSRQAPAIQQVIRGFIRESDHLEEAPLHGSGLHPSQWVWALPKGEGGWGLPDVETFAGAMAARGVARLFAPGGHPWKGLTMHLLGSAQPDLANSAAWIITAPRLLRLSNSRLQTMATAVADLSIHRIIHPDDQSFYSVMTEPILANRRITRGGTPPIPLRSSDLVTAEGKKWSHLREVRRAYRGIHEGGDQRVGIARDVNLVLGLLPRAWREKVTSDEPDPVSEWSAVGGGDQVIFEGEGGPTLFDVRRNGSLERCGGGISDDTPRRAAAVHFRRKQGPQPLGAAEWEAAAGGIWLLGEWNKLVLDPTVWGIDKSTPLHLLTVKASRVRLCQKRAVKELPSYRLGLGIIPPTWEDRPLPGPTVGMPTHIPLLPLPGGRVGGPILQQRPAAGEGVPQLRQMQAGGAGGGGAQLQQQRPDGGPHGRGVGQQPLQPPVGGGGGDQQLQQPEGGGRAEQQQEELLAGDEANDGGQGQGRGLLAMESRWTAHRTGRGASLNRPAQRDFEDALHSSLPLWLRSGGQGSSGRDRRAARRGRLLGEGGEGEREEEVGDGGGVNGAPSASSDHHNDLLDTLRPPGQVLEGGRGVVGVWQRVHHSGGSQAEASLGWQLLHAALPVRAKVAYQLSKPLGEGECEARGCNQQETLSHAFMDCQRVRGAVKWLLDLYETLSGRRPPWDTRVILADDQRVWRPGSTKEDQLLWQRLRMTTLYHVWRARCSRHRYEDGGGDLTAAVVGGAAADISASIRRDWARTRMADTIEEAGGAHLYSSRRNLSITVDAFKALWARRGVLCSVSGQPSTMVLKVPSTWVVHFFFLSLQKGTFY